MPTETGRCICEVCRKQSFVSQKKSRKLNWNFRKITQWIFTRII